MDKSLAVQTTAEEQTQPLWQGWRKGGRERERGGREGERETKMLSYLASQSGIQLYVYLLTKHRQASKYFNEKGQVQFLLPVQ